MIRNKHAFLGKRSSSVKENILEDENKAHIIHDMNYGPKTSRGDKGHKSVRFLEQSRGGTDLTKEPFREKNILGSNNQTIDNSNAHKI
jgi:hypothetical protein